MVPSRFGLRRLVQGAGFGALLALSISVFAKGRELDLDNRVIPYNGTLEQNGSAYTGVVDLQFTLTGTATVDGGGSASTTFTETHTSVAVYAGKFTADLGSKTTGGIPSWIFDQEQITLAIGIKATSAATYTPLSGNQRIRPVPFSYWSGEGNQFKTDGDTFTAGGANFVLGTSDGLAQTTSTTDGGVRSQRALVHTSGDVLNVNYNSDFEGGTLIGGPVKVNSGLTINNQGIQVNSGGVSITGGGLAIGSGGDLNLTNGAFNFTQGSMTMGSGNLTLSSGNIAVTSGSLTLSSGTATINSGSNIYGLTVNTSGSSAEITVANGRSGKWFFGVGGGGGGADDFFWYNLASLTNRMTLSSAGNLTVSGNTSVGGNLSVTGSVTHATSCPGSAHFNVTKDSQKSRLCVYKDDTNRSWGEAVRYCWDNIPGAKLCTISELRIACMSGMSLSTNHWTADRAVDDQAFEVNTTNCDNFDGDVDHNDPNGAYCCLWDRQL